MRRNLFIVAALCTPLIAGCASGGLSKRETGALGGGALGAGAGALIGHQSGHTAGGAAIGGALGALAGTAAGYQVQPQQERSSAMQRQINKQRREIRKLNKHQPQQRAETTPAPAQRNQKKGT